MDRLSIIKKMSKQLCRIISFNCKSLKRSINGVKELCELADVIVLQELWLFEHDLPLLGSIHKDFAYTGTSAMDSKAGLLTGRPYGGVAVLWRKSVFPDVSVIKCNSVRLAAIRINVPGSSVLVFSVYMPVNVPENLPLFSEVMGEICAICEETTDIEAVYILGDFNAHPNELFCRELLQFCVSQDWYCIDLDMLGTDSETYTFTSDAHGCNRWLDHCIVTEAARQTVRNIKVKYDVYWSDHLPLILECNLNKLHIKNTPVERRNEGVMWGERGAPQVELYQSICEDKLKLLDFPAELTVCADRLCNDPSHKMVLDNMYIGITNILTYAARKSSGAGRGKGRGKFQVVGWNKYVADAHRDARSKFLLWMEYKKPKDGPIYRDMYESRKFFKSKLKSCQDSQEQIKCDILATNRKNKDFKAFWKHTNKWNVRAGVPVSVGGENDQKAIANNFRHAFDVSPLLKASEAGECGAEAVVGVGPGRFTSKEVAKIIKSMQRGKSPGHDGLSIEHLKHAGKHLPRVLAMLYTLCLSHTHLPRQLTRTVVVPIVKNKTGDLSDPNNYRPISLATILAKVLDSLLNAQLCKHINLHDAQFGFRPELSTECAILCLKRAVRFYKDRNTPIYACFLDLSKAFDLVVYDKLWCKLAKTGVPSQYVALLKHWYNSQVNRVRWGTEESDEYRLQCGVRQGGLTSPLLFNLYVNELIERLGSAHVGCHIGDVCFNNISYADDMALLGPSVDSVRQLVKICEGYAEQHGLKYNTAKSELLIFKARKYNSTTEPKIMLCGVPLKVVDRFKYLGHMLTENLNDDLDLERERRAMAIRGNMLARRFARCSESVKVTLFRAYCQTFYTCSLWVRFTQRAYNTLRVQYNNILRMLLGLPKYCSASSMFAEARLDDFFAIRRKRVASMLRRVRGSTNGLLRVVAERLDCPITKSWVEVAIGRAK
jgi:exonuclease III